MDSEEKWKREEEEERRDVEVVEWLVEEKEREVD